MTTSLTAATPAVAVSIILTDLLWQQNVLVFLQSLFHCVVEVGIANTWAVKSREQIADETQEQWNVIIDELGKIHVAKCSHQHHVLHTPHAVSVIRGSK